VRTTGIAELKASLSEFLARVKAGEEVLITDRGRPVARIVPVGAHHSEGVEDLVRAGVLRAPRRSADSAVWKGPAPKDPSGSVRRELLAERRGGR
jgi:prevent-host-death family protein